MAEANKWYVITGGPCTGKTTLLAELEKLGYKTFPEAARVLIDEAVAKGISIKDELRADEKRFQEQVARLKAKVETAHEASTLTFFDRGMHDTLAYMRHYDFEIEAWLKTLHDKAHYKKVFLLEPLDTYQPDYARTEGPEFTKYLNRLLKEAYTEYGMTPIKVKAIKVKQRVEFILDHIKGDKA